MPLTKKGQKIKRELTKEYGTKRGTSIFYAMKNAGKVTGVERKKR